MIDVQGHERRSASADARSEEKSMSLIVAMDQAGLIGRDGGLPWRLPNDLAHFKRLTLGKTILMGRRTWDSLGRALPGRDNWVVSRAPGLVAAGARVFSSLEAALAEHRKGELMVIGGAEMYRQTLDRADRLYLTEVQTRLAAKSGDICFPEFLRAGFEELSREEHPADDRHAWPYRFLSLRRRR